MPVSSTAVGIYALERNESEAYRSSVPTLAENLKTATTRTIGLKELAKRLERTSQTVSDVLNAKGRSTIGVARLLKFATALNMTVEDLVTGVDPHYDRMRRDLLASRMLRGSSNKELDHDVSTLIAQDREAERLALAQIAQSLAEVVNQIGRRLAELEDS